MSPLAIILIVFAGVVLAMLVRVPVAFAFGLGSIVMVLWLDMDTRWIIPLTYSVLLSFPLLAIPLFVFLGIVMEISGTGRRLIDFVNVIVGRVKGGLGVVTVVSCGLFGAISGSAASAIYTIGTLMLPRMKEEGYPLGYATGLVACSAMLALFIPPSMDMIIFGFIGRISIAACFLAAAGPGILLIIFYSIINVIMCRKFALQALPKTSPAGLTKEFLKAGKRGLLVLLMPVIILGGIYGGVFTPTEAAAVAAAVAILVGFIYRSLTLRKFVQATLTTATITGAIMTVGFFMLTVSRVLVWEDIATSLVKLLSSVSPTVVVQLLMVDVLLIFIGMVMDDTSATILSGILLLPVANQLGVNPYHMAGLVMANLGLGLITPPVAPLLYMAGQAAGNIPLSQFIKYTVPFMIFGNLPVILITTLVPKVSTYLPNLVLGTGL